MEAIDYFNTDYFLLELQRAGVIKNDHENDPLSLEKVPNITIGLVLAAKSLKKFENHIILNWIRRGRKVTALIEEQFALYDKLSLYLQRNVCTKEEIQEWKQIMDETKYVFPEKENRGWSQIFGDTPNLLEKVDPENISNTFIVQHPKKIIDTEDEENKQDNETDKSDISDESCKSEPSISQIFFSHNYFLSLLREVGAIVSNDTEKDIPIYLVKVPNLTIGLVLAAKAINLFTDEAILTWVRKGRNITPSIEKQFLLYEKLADYLMNYIDLKDIDKWKLLLNSKYVFPSSDNEEWSLIFGEIPELCHKIDKAQKSFEILETSKIEIEAHKSNKQEETPEKEMDQAKTSCKQLEISLKECDEAQKTCDQLETSKTDIDETQISCDQLESSMTEENVKKDIAKSDKTKSLSDNPAVSINKTTVNEIKENEGKNEAFAEIKQAAFTGSDSDQIKHIDESIDEMAVNGIKKDLDQNEGVTEIKEAADTGSNSDQTSHIDKSNTELSNLSGNKISSSELCKDTMTQSEGDDTSNSDDDWEDIFDAVGEELTAAENNDEYLSESVIKSKKDEKNCLSDDDIYDVNNALDYEFSIDSDNEMPENAEDGSDDLDDGENVLDLEVKTNELFESMDTEFGATETETTNTISNCMKHSENNVEHKSKKVPKGFTRNYFYSVLKEAGIYPRNDKSNRKLTLLSNITVGILCAIKALDIYTNKQIFAWISKCRNLSRKMSLPDHIKLASYRELGNFLMNEVDIKDIEGWKIFMENTSYLDYSYQTESDWRKVLQNHQWKLPFKYDQYVPEICHSFKIKFNSNYFLAQLLGYGAIRREIKDGAVHYYLVEIVELRFTITVGLVLAAKAVDIFSDKDIVSWICRCKKIASIDSEKIHEQLAIYKEFYNYLEKEADERDYEYVMFVLFSTIYVPWIKDTDKPCWDVCFNQKINLHKRFRDFRCCYDLLSKEKLASMEVVDPVCHEPSEVCQIWNDLFAENYDQVSDKNIKDNPFHSNYFQNLLIAKKVTGAYENEDKSSKLNEVKKVTVGLVMATIHQQFDKQEITDWVEKSHGTKPSRRQFFMYEILCDHLINLKCNIEASYWEQLINSVEYQVPVENCDIWSNIFGNQIPNLLGVTLVGKFEFERLYRGLTCYNRDEYKTEFLECIQLTHDLQTSDCGSINENQNVLFDKKYFASLLTSCGALSDSRRILKSVADLTIGHVMAAIIDNTLNEEDIYEWIKQSEKNPYTIKTLETLNFKSQFLAYKLLASYLMNYPNENQNDSFLNSWGKFLNTRYVFSNVGDFPLERFVSPQINSIYLSSEWCISKKYELKSIVQEIRESFQTESFEKINDIMVTNEKSIPIFHIMNKKKIFGVGKSFFLKKLIKDRVMKKNPVQLQNSTLNKVKGLTVGHVLGVFALGIFKETVIKNWIAASLDSNGVVPFGPLKRISHYLLCEVPRELKAEWAEILDKSFDYWSENDGLGNIHSLFRLHYKRYLCNDVDIFKHNNDYIPNECRKFISGNCTKDGCKQHHICCKKKFCMSFSKSHDVKATKGESESMITTKDETGSDYWEDENLDEYENEEFGSIHPQHSAGSVHSRLGPQQIPIVQHGYEQSTKILVRCNSFVNITEDDLRKCFSQFGKVVACKRKHRYGFVIFENGNAADKAAKQTGKLYLKGKLLKIKTATCGDKTNNEKEFRISGMCNKFNAFNACSDKQCSRPHFCDGCGGDHPKIKCTTRKQTRGREKDDSDDDERENKRSKFESEHLDSSSEILSNFPVIVDESQSDGEDEKQFEIPGMCKWYNTTVKCRKKQCKWPHRCNECGGDHPQFKCTNKQQRREEEKGENVMTSRKTGMCNKYNNLENCLHTPCLYPHRCDECGGEHPRRKCTGKGEDEKQFEIPGMSKIEIPGMCKFYNSKRCNNVQCKWPHRCNECGGDHPQFKCSNRQQRRIQEKGKDRSQMRKSRSRSPVHNRSKYLSDRDKSPSWQHQLPSLPPPEVLASARDKSPSWQQQIPSLLPPQVFASARNKSPSWQHQLPLLPTPQVLASASHPRVSQSANQSNSPHMSQSTSPHMSQSTYQFKNSNTPSDTSSKFSVLGVSNILNNMCDHFDVEFKNLCKKTLSKVFEVKHNEEKMIEVFAGHLNVLRGVIDELSEQLETVHDTQTKMLLTKCVSDTKYLLKKAKSVSMNSLRKPAHSEKQISPSSSIKESLLSGVVERVAKVTLNKDTSCIIENIKKEVESLGIPATMEIIGKMVVEISEHHKMIALKGVLSDYYDHGSSSNPIHEPSESTDYRQPNSNYYGHDSSSNPINEPSVSTDYVQPNWNQNSGMPSQQRAEHIYQSSGDNHTDNTWFQNSGNIENPQPSQRSRSRGIRRGGRSNNHPDNTRYESSDSMENPQPSQRSRSRGIRRGGRSNNQPENTWYESSDKTENFQPAQRSRSRGIRRGGRSNNHPENTWYESSDKTENFQPAQRSRSRGIRRGGRSNNQPENTWYESSDSMENPQPSQRSRSRGIRRGGRSNDHPENTWYESSDSMENPQPSQSSRSRGISRGGRSNNHPDNTRYESSDSMENPQPSQRSRSRGIRRGGRSNNHPKNTWYESSGNMENPQPSQRSSSRGIRRGGRSNNHLDNTRYESSGNMENPQPSQSSRSRGIRRGGGSNNHQDNTWFQSSGNMGNPQPSQRSRSRGIRRGGKW